MNETDFFDRDSNYQSNTSLVYKYVEPLIHEIIKCKFNLRNWWIQKYKKENYHDLHIHGTLPSWFSFILYLLLLVILGIEWYLTINLDTKTLG